MGMGGVGILMFLCLGMGKDVGGEVLEGWFDSESFLGRLCKCCWYQTLVGTQGSLLVSRKDEND